MTRPIAKRCVPVCQRPDSDCPLTLLSFGDDKVPWHAYVIPKAFMDEASYKDLRRLFLTVLPEGHVRYMI